MLFDYVLRGNTSVIRPWQPQHVVTSHPFPATDNIRKGLVKSVPNMQNAGHIRRRQYHAKHGTGCRRVGAERTRRFPEGVPFRVDGRMIKPFG